MSILFQGGTVLAHHYDSYSQLHAINSHKTGDLTQIDLCLGFEDSTSFAEITNLKNQMQTEFDTQFGNCVVNIIVGQN